jgi:site-specific DNA recombinase
MPSATLRRPKKKVNPAGLINAVLYLRMSTDRQDKSIETQRIELTAWASKNHYHIVDEYVDEGISGDDTENRLDFQQMIEDAANGTFSAILCWDQDRFGRFDLLDAGYWIRPLRDAGVYLHTMSQGRINWDDYSGRLMYGIQQEAKHQFVIDIARNTSRGMLARAKQGLWNGGTPPRGFSVERKINPVTGDKVTGKLILGAQKDIKLVLEIFNAYDNGKSLRGIAADLNKKYGNSTARGRGWNSSGLRKILSNDLYTGDYSWPTKSRGKYYCIKDQEVSSTVGETGERVFIEENHPQIISKEQFGRVQDKLMANRKKTVPHQNGGKFFLTGLLFCSHCGARMSGKTMAYKNTRYVMYQCSTNATQGSSACGCNLIKQEALMENLLVALEEFASDDSIQTQFADELKALTEKVGSVDNVADLEQRKVVLDKQLASAAKRMLSVDDDLLSLVQEQLKELKSEHSRVVAELELAKTPVEDLENAHNAKYRQALERITKVRRLVEKSEACEVRSLLGELIQKIELSFDKRPVGKVFKYDLRCGHITFHEELYRLKGLPTPNSSELVHSGFPVFTSSDSVFSVISGVLSLARKPR